MSEVNYKQLIGKPLERAFKVKKDALDRDNRTILQMPITSEEPILHWVMGRGVAYVILDHSPKSINLSRLKASAPFLENHSPQIRLGRLRNPAIVDKELRIDARVNSRSYSDEIFNEIAEDLDHGDTPGLSAGFTIEEFSDKVEGYRDGFPIIRAIQWTPFEASLASMQADLKTAIGRCIGEPYARLSDEPTEELNEPDDTPEDNPTNVRSKSMNDLNAPTAPAPAAPVTPPPSPLILAQTRTSEFVTFAQLYANTEEQKTELTEMAREFALTGKSEDELRGKIQEIRSAWTTKPPAAMPKLNEKEKQQYSIARAIMADASGRHGGEDLNGDKKCFERDVSQQIAKDLSLRAKRGGFFMPTGLTLRGHNPATASQEHQFMRWLQQMMQRSGLDTQTSTKGQELVFTEAGSFIDMLRNKAMVIKLGATVLPGLVGNVAFPRQTGAGAAHWVSENPGQDVQDDDAALDQVVLIPKTLMSSTSYSRQLLAQGTVNVDNIVQNDLTNVNALELDRSALHGTGANNQPTGIYALNGVNSTSFLSGGNPGVITFAGAIDMETKISVANADIGVMAYLTTPEVRGTAKQTAELSNTIALALWRDGEMNGFRAEATNQMSKSLGTGNDHGLVFGVWDQLLIGEWGAIEVITDPYRLKKQGMIEVTTFMMADIEARYAQAFTKATGLKKA